MMSFNSDANWISWNAHLHALAAIHGVSCVLDPEFVPTTADEVQLFRAQQDFVYSVFHRCLKSPGSKKIIRANEHTRDAQQVYKLLLAEYSDNAHVKIRIKKLTTELSTLQLDDNWNRSLEAFFTHFENKILDLEKTSGETVPEERKRNWLESAIMHHTDLNGAYNASLATLAIREGSHDMPYHQMFKMLKYLAVSIDEKTSAKRKTTKANAAKRRGQTQANNSQSTAADGWNGNGPKPAWWLPPAKFKTMTKEQRHAHFKKHGKPQKGPRSRSTNESNQSSSTPAPSPAPAPAPASAPVSTAAASTPAPGTLLRTLLSNSASQTQTPSEFTIGGRTFREVNTCTRQYRSLAAQTYVACHGSLVDGGCNGGLGGEDVRFIDSTLHKVDVHGIGNATISSVPVGTAAGLITTTTGPVIGYFHQYALYGKRKTIHSSNQLRAFGNIVDDIPRSLKGS